MSVVVWSTWLKSLWCSWLSRVFHTDEVWGSSPCGDILDTVFLTCGRKIMPCGLFFLDLCSKVSMQNLPTIGYQLWLGFIEWNGVIIQGIQYRYNLILHL